MSQRDPRTGRFQAKQPYRAAKGSATRKAVTAKVTVKEPKPPVPSQEEARIVNLLPMALRAIAREIVVDPQMNEYTKPLMERAGEFDRPFKALLTGIALHPPARSYFDQQLDRMWESSYANQIPDAVPEVVVGGGLHAAIYAAVRVATGHKPPLVLEQRKHPGGSFACSLGPSFYLNSRNRPGKLSIPGDAQGALNFLPGSSLQPADIGTREYQSNDELAWAIRIALSMYAKVVSGFRVMGISSTGFTRQPLAVLGAGSDGFTRRIYTKRVVVATGLRSKPKVTSVPRLMTFEDMMKRMDEHFPLRGMKRVAVLGAGDSGKTAVEALVGQGPKQHGSVAALDWIDRIDWYGCPQATRQDWERCQRSRYRGIGRFLANALTPGVPARIRVLPLLAGDLSSGFDCIYAGNVPYDYVIDCRGYDSDPGVVPLSTTESFAVGARQVARKEGARPVYVIGPASAIAVTPDEQAQLRNIQENSTSIFRYAGRTAALAASLD